MERQLLKQLKKLHPPEKMILLPGPRQVGKTTMAQQALEGWPDQGIYLNWDISEHRKRILSNDDLLADWRRPAKRPMIIFDELHKMRRFKSWLKGFYDEFKNEAAIWATGSGRLDLYQKGGDSLLGRYFLYRMHPLSLGELQSKKIRNTPVDPDKDWETFVQGNLSHENIEPLLNFGGFPEPFLKQNQSFHKRWIRSRRELITHEDIRDLTRIEDVARLEHLVRLLNPRISSPLSINSLKEDLSVAFETVRGWIRSLEHLYYIYGVPPYSHRLQRAIKREQKYYFWDWSEVREESARFENFVMSHLNKACHTWTDFGLGDFKLWYLRDREKREVDALITRDNSPWMMIEIKLNDLNVSRPLQRYAQLLKCKNVVQVVKPDDIYRQIKIESRIYHVVSAGMFLLWLP
jgi:predicted AAA+ superfamily ATPase